MPKIVVTQNMDFDPDQLERLKSLGDVVIYDDLAKDEDEWLTRCQGADIICTGKFGLKKKIYDLNNVFISLPFVGVGWLDREKLMENNITVAYSPGCNKLAVSEWVVGGKHTAFEHITAGVPKHLHGEAKKAAEELIKEGLILTKLTGYGLQIMLNSKCL